MVATGMLRAAQKAAETDRCAVAEVLWRLSGFGAVAVSASSPVRYKKALDITGTAAGAASAVTACHARARAPKETTS
jgi:hypothetical protein